MVHLLRDIAGGNLLDELASFGYGGCESATPLAKDDLKMEDAAASLAGCARLDGASPVSKAKPISSAA